MNDQDNFELDGEQVADAASSEKTSALPVLVDELHAPVMRLGHPDALGTGTAFIHGVLGSPSMWKSVAGDPLMGPSIGLPLPGHYPWTLNRVQTSSALNDFAFLQAYARALRGHMTGKVHIVAHSTGSMTALKFAALFPELVSKLTLVGAFADGGTAFMASRMGRTVAIPYLGPAVFSSLYNFWTSTPANYLYGLSTAMSKAHEEAPSAAELSMLQDLRRSDWDALREVVLWIQHTDVREDLKHVRVPVTVLVSQDDPVVDVETQLKLVRDLPNSNAVICRLGHLPMFEAPHTMRRLILSA